MKTAILAILFLAAPTFAQQAAHLRMLPGERWWAGVISESHLMPFTAGSSYQFDFEANTAGNQGQPLPLRQQRVRRSTPTRVEKTRRARWRKGGAQVHPHARGENW